MNKVAGQWWLEWDITKPMGDGARMKLDGGTEEGLLEMAETSSQATATTKVGITHNLGNFESLRIDVGVTIPVGEYQTEPEAIDQAYKISEEKLLEKFNELKRHF